MILRKDNFCDFEGDVSTVLLSSSVKINTNTVDDDDQWEQPTLNHQLNHVDLKLSLY